MTEGAGAYSIDVSAHAQRDIQTLPEAIAGLILQEVQARLTIAPHQEIKTRIKRLTGFAPPLYRLRVGDYRVYYRILPARVIVLAVLHKKDSDRWLN